MQRILLAGLVGGLVVFLWGAVAHLALPFGEMGFTKAPGEAAAIAALQAALPEPGLYALPDMRDVAADQLPASGPFGFLAWRPETSYAMGRNLGLEFLSGALAALLAAFVLQSCAPGLGAMRTGAAMMAFGLFAWLAIDASYWNWFGFSSGFFLSQGVQQAIGWLLAGLAMGAVLRARSGGS